MVFLPSSFFRHNVRLMVWSNFYYIRQKVLVVIVGKGVFGLPIPKGFIVTLDQYNWINLPLAPRPCASEEINYFLDSAQGGLGISINGRNLAVSVQCGLGIGEETSLTILLLYNGIFKFLNSHISAVVPYM